MSKQSKNLWFVWIGVWAIVLISLLPILWLGLGSFKTPAELWAYPPKMLPKNPSLKNFRTILSGNESRLPFLLNSLITAVIATVCTLVLAIPASYGLARMRLKRSKSIEFWILSTRMMPQIASVIPLFIIIRSIGLFDSHVGLIYVYVVSNLSYAVWMLTTFFRKVPIEVEEAAYIDGCSTTQVFLKVSTPLIFPSIMTIAAFIFTFCWNELLFSLVLTGNIAKTLPVAISEYTSGNFYRWELITAASIIQVVPALIVIIFIQKYIVSGLTMGAVKQ